MATQVSTSEPRLNRYVSPLAAWALAFGSAVGWGAFMMPGNTFLPLAGPVGSVVGIMVGMAIMLIIAFSYHYLINQDQDSGGAFAYVRKCFGYDHAFLCAWYLVLVYIAIMWANATALPLIMRQLVGSFFQVGLSYDVAGFQVYLGEIALAALALVLCGFACIRLRGTLVQVVAALVLAVGAVACFVGVYGVFHEGMSANLATPMASGSAFSGALNIIALAPWAYVGFESISHASEEFTFSPKKSFAIMAIALLLGGMVYALLVVIAASAQPAGFASWTEYIAGLGELSGTEAAPTFYVLWAAMGDTGRLLIGVTAMGAIITGVVGNLYATSRLMYAMAREKMLPDWFAQLDERGVPRNVILFIVAISLPILFCGRTAIVWIVDVTTVGASIAYVYTSACAYKTAKANNDRGYVVLGTAGIAVSALFLLFFLVPSLLSVDPLSAESYLILSTWSILGLAFFRYMFVRDVDQRLGHSTVTLVVTLFLILFTSHVWIRQTTDNATNRLAQQITDGTVQPTTDAIAQALQHVSRSIKIDAMVQMVLVVAALIFVFEIFTIMHQRQRQMEVAKALAEESSRAKTSFLSNMSHEIRTPMNAIIGLDNIALRNPDLDPHTRDQLVKIGDSARHLLDLINDILDMSRIESGRMVLKRESFAFRAFLNQINIMIGGQCQDKGLRYECSIVGLTNDYYVGDDMKLKQVLINILGNAVKFTEAPGTVTFAVQQTNVSDGRCTLRFTISDTGIGMDEEYLPKIFEAFSQEDSTATNRYGGSGLGMAITKSIVEMMDGELTVESTKGVGTTFYVTVTLGESDRTLEQEGGDRDLARGLKALVVDDDEIACEHARLVLGEIGVKADICTDSKDALKLAASHIEQNNAYDLLLTDYLMPGMDGIELTQQLRLIDGGKTIVLVLTGYSFDGVADTVWGAGADGMVDKPLFADALTREIELVMRRKGISPVEVIDADEAEAAEISESDLESRHVLLADDIEINAEIMIDVLDMEGITAEHADNGQVAVELFAQNEPGHFDAILMDVRMPVMDGLEATRAIRALDRPDAQTIPIVALTANAFDEDVQQSLEAGMNAHLSKPVEPDQLYATLAQLIAAGGINEEGR